mmetsp:Transcript_101/g.239  ORF Transcript_101/g.239 Transcript_101/m.239 type:complete len:270 (-) Transcript_101:91-900(-)
MVHAMVVELEEHRRGIDPNRDDGLVKDSLRECHFVARRHVAVAGDRRLHPAALGAARRQLAAGARRIRVLRLGVGDAPLLLHDVQDAVVRLAALVACVGSAKRAVGHLLLRKGAALDLALPADGAACRGNAAVVRAVVGALHCCHRAEAPARTALALVLHFGHNPLVHPVPRERRRHLRPPRHRLDRGHRGLTAKPRAEHRAAVLCVGPVSKAVRPEAHRPASSDRFRVLALNKVCVVGKDCEPCLLLGLTRIHLAVRLLPLGKGRSPH